MRRKTKLVSRYYLTEKGKKLWKEIVEEAAKRKKKQSLTSSKD